MIPDVVFDTNIIYAGLRSRQGASYDLLNLVGGGKFLTHVSVPLALEYEEVLLRYKDDLIITTQEIYEFLTAFCTVSQEHSIYYLWWPFLRDADDDMVLEVAVVGQCHYIITFNERDFAGCEQFGVRTIRPGAFLTLIGEGDE